VARWAEAASGTLAHALALDNDRSTPDGHGVLSKPISPELVLVDPELARIAREALPEAPPAGERLQLVPGPGAPPPVHESPLAAPPPLPLALPSALPPSEVPPPARRVPEWFRLLLAAALGGLIVAAVPPVAHRVGDALTPPGPVLGEPPAQTAPTTTGSPKPTASKPRQAPTVGQPQTHARTDPPTGAKQRAERLVLRGLARAKKGSVPAGLLDPATGLVKTNVQVSCTPTGTSVSVFECLVRVGGTPPGAGLVVGCRLLPGDRAELSWRGYRRS
jgi:hypothetical protein